MSTVHWAVHLKAGIDPVGQASVQGLTGEAVHHGIQGMSSVGLGFKF